MWIVVVLITLLLLVMVFGLLRTRGGMPPTDYKRLFTLGVIFVGAGLPIWLSAGMPALFLTGLVFMGLSGFNRDKWEENAEANKWENLTDEQKATRKMVNRLILGLVILGLVAFALFAWVAA
ncbi:MAG: hypothetical protein OER95_11310 [Acidimicrobiia bacterium]|nr:hypothetical protein [Acidimicrobiia bacterium]